MKQVRITHRPSGLCLAEGPLGWGITPFEGNLYISRRYVKTRGFRPNFLVGLCIYKFLYVWMDLHLDRDTKVRNLAWIYWLPNPLLPFIWYRVAVSRAHREILVEEFESVPATP